MNALLSLEPAGDSPQLSPHLTMSRIDPTAANAPFLAARTFLLGENGLSDLPLISSSDNEIGIAETYGPLCPTNQVMTHTFRGPLPADWDAELYRDVVLIAYQPADGSSYYEFRNVPLYYGYNAFRIIKYGPNGERQVEQQNFNIAQGMKAKGDSQSKVVLNPHAWTDARVAWQQDKGLSNNLTISNGITGYRLDGERHDYVFTGLQGYIHGMAWQTKMARDLAQGWAGLFDVQTRFGSTDVALQQITTQQFSNECFASSANQQTGSSTLSINNLLLPKLMGFRTCNLTVNHVTYCTGLTATVLQGLLSAKYHNLYLYNMTNWSENCAPGAQISHTLTGNATTLRLHGSQLFQTEISYNMLPTALITSMGFSVTNTLRNNNEIELGISQNMTAHETTLELGIVRYLKSCALRAQLQYIPGKRVMISGNIFSGIGCEPSTGHWEASPQSIVTQGEILVRVFVDHRQNGKYDPADQLLSEVGFLINGEGNTAKSDEHGVAHLRNIPCYYPVELA